MYTQNDVSRATGAKLVVLEKSRIRVYPLDQRQKWLLGRETKSQQPEIPLLSKIASRKHGWFMGREEEWYFVDNPENLNGTYLNGNRIQRPVSGTRKPTPLKDGDVLRIDSGDPEQKDEITVLLYTTREVRGNWTMLPLGRVEILTIGRDGDCELVMQDPEISGKHAKLTCLNGRYYLSDCGSKAGTVLNGEKIQCPVALVEKDHFSLCGRNFFFLGDNLLFER